MKKLLSILGLSMVVVFWSTTLWAHFGMVIPSDNMVMQGEDRTVKIVLSFSHPFEGAGMELVQPAEFGVSVNGKKESLLDALKETTVMGQKAWEADYRINRPGVYTFYMTPKPYWEPAEDCFIVHYTKTVIAAFGDEDGWDERAELKTEIKPLTRPFGLYAGNAFQGIVYLDGKPAPYSEVEVEYYNADGAAEAPSDYMVTQVVKADANGVFTYAPPVAGWWGFAALNGAAETIKHEGDDKDIELGAVLWVKFEDWKVK